jgi:hypothetical protein
MDHHWPLPILEALAANKPLFAINFLTLGNPMSFVFCEHLHKDPKYHQKVSETKKSNNLAPNKHTLRRCFGAIGACTSIFI